MKRVLLRGGRLFDPGLGSGAAAASTKGTASKSQRLDEVGDLLIEDGHIVRMGGTIDVSGPPNSETEVIDATGMLVVPGLIDLHVHLREPGQEYKEDIASGTRAAAAGGFTAVCPMPNTAPTNDGRAVTELMVRRAKEVGYARVFPVGAISKGLAGEELAEIGEMKEAGIVAISDDGRPVMHGGLMRRAMEYARTFDLPVVQHAEDLSLSSGGAMNEGAVATAAGLPGQPAAAEAAMVARDLELCELTGARYHVAHVSTAATCRLLREAKSRGLPVTAEVTPHHLFLTDAACASYDTSTKCAPPLRTADDLAALRAALADGTIDCVATDHAPHSTLEKDVEFESAAFGIIGLETALPLILKLVEEKILTLERAITALTSAPAKVFGLTGLGRLCVGGVADVAVIDPKRTLEVAAHGYSKSKNTPFAGWKLKGAAAMTICGGRITHDSRTVSPGQAQGDHFAK